MDLRQARHFVAVVAHGNVLGAANAIHLSQPALTKSIQNLEAEFGVKLFDRGPRGMAPTIYGRALFEHAKSLLSESDKCVSDIRALKDGRRGHLRLGIANFAVYFLPSVIAKLLVASPGLSFDVVDGNYEALVEQVREGTLDAVISGLPPVGRAEDLVHEELISGEFVIVCRPDRHPFAAAGNRVRSIEELQAAQWILPNRPRAIHDIWELSFLSRGKVPPIPALKSGSFLFVRALVLEGSFVTLLPRDIVREEVERGVLAVIAIDLPYARTTEGIIYRPGEVRMPALDILIAAIRAEWAERRGRSG
jgi:DNA-binding transcriptional LysR family regulator